MKLEKLTIDGLVVISPDIYKDDRGFFYESYHERKYNEIISSSSFSQDNISFSTFGTIRGLHFQTDYPQGKLIQCLTGMIFDVVVDIRKNSKTFGMYNHVILSAKNKKQFWIPPGFAHGFMALDNENLIQYKCTTPYFPEGDKTLLWSDPKVNILWPHCDKPLLSPKDEKGYTLDELIDKDYLL